MIMMLHLFIFDVAWRTLAKISNRGSASSREEVNIGINFAKGAHFLLLDEKKHKPFLSTYIQTTRVNSNRITPSLILFLSDSFSILALERLVRKKLYFSKLKLRDSMMESLDPDVE